MVSDRIRESAGATVSKIGSKKARCIECHLRTERDILRNILGQVMARHDHVEMLVNGVGSIRLRRVGATGKNVGILDQGYHVWSVATAGALDMVGVDCPTLEGRCSSLDETGLVQRIAVDLSLDVVFIAYPGLSIQRLSLDWIYDNSYVRQVLIAAGVQPQSSCNLRPAQPALIWSYNPGLPVSLPFPIMP